MKLLRSLSMRVLLAAVLSGGVGLASAFEVSKYATQKAAGTLVNAWLKQMYPRQRGSCEASPSTWSSGTRGRLVVFAYDGATGLSQNPAAPPLDQALYRRLGDRVEEAVVEGVDAPFQAGIILFRGAASGPCAILQATWPQRSAPRDVALVVVIGVVAAAVAAAGLGFFLVVRPLAGRVRRLHAAAERVGEPGAYAPARRGVEDELDRVAAALDRAHGRIVADAARLEQRRQDLRRHLADVAHDLRTPLASLQLAVEQAADASSDPSQADVLAGALRDCVYLSALTNNLRLASQLEEGWDPFTADARVDLKDAVERVVARVGVLAKRRGIELACAVPDDPVLARCDPVACEQAVGNIVENAVSYGHSGGHVAVVLRCERDGGFVLRVVDDGPGVPPTEVPRLGERTFRSDEARRRDPRGSGLGLAITSEVCARCGWELSFEAEVPRGLRVTIRGARMREGTGPVAAC